MPGLILIVDDDRDACEALRIRLTASGLDAVACGTGEEALHFFKELAPKLILLDASLPGLSGPEVCESIRALDTDHNTTVVFVSGATSPSPVYVERCASLSGADGFIRKPYDIQEILDLADKVCAADHVCGCLSPSEGGKQGGPYTP